MSHDKRLKIAGQMPPLRRIPFGEIYDASKDEVLLWLKEQPELLKKLFEMAHQDWLLNLFADKLRSWGCITFDKKSGTWRGADYHD